MPQAPGDAVARLDWRTNLAIVIGMLVPIAVLAVMAWLSTIGVGRSSTVSVEAADGSRTPVPSGPARRLKVQVLASFPHDPSVSTEGLHFEGNGIVYESTGREGQSTLRRVDLATGRILKAFALAPDLVAAGVARTPRALLQLTRRDHVALVYDPASLTVIGQFPYQGDGVGVCHDGTRLVMSDGSETLTFRGRMDFVVERSVRVVQDGAPVTDLGELECAHDSIYATVRRDGSIVRIDPASGSVLERIDAGGLLDPNEARSADVLNGIAHDRFEDVFYLTGRRWPKLFKVRFVPAAT